MIRLIALDLDQTLFGTDLIIAPRVLDTVRCAQEKGALVTIATGREARLATKFARELEILSPIICAQGGCVYDHLHDRVLRDIRLPSALLPEILKSAERFGWNIHFEMSEKLFFPPTSSHPPVLFELLRYSNWVRVGDLLKDMPEPPNKVIVTVNAPEDRSRTAAEMLEAFGEKITVVPSHPHLVEGLPAGVNKATGLKWLARELKVPQTDVMAVGDSEADVPMLEWAGLGVAMGNASPEAKEIADWIAPTVEDYGAAVAIERFVLSA